MNTNKTYIGILNVFESFANAHANVHRFKSDFEEQISEWTSKDESFPVLFVAPISNIYDRLLTSYTVRVYCYDRLQKDRKNVNNILTTTNEILSNLTTWLRDGNVGIDFETLGTANPINNEFMSFVAGWYLDIEVQARTGSICDIPFISSPLITGYTCDIQYDRSFLTCETLEGCEVITDMQTNIATNTDDIIILSGNVFTLSGSVETIQDNLTILSGNVETIQDDVFTLSGSVETIQDNVLKLSGNTISGVTIIDNVLTISTPTTSFSAITTAVTGFTYNDSNLFIIQDNQGNQFETTIDIMSGLTINGNLNVTTIDQTNSIDFNLTGTSSNDIGRLKWNDVDGTLDLGLKGGNVTLQLGQENVVRVVNKAGVNLTEAGYKVVYISGAQGQRLGVKLALANSDLTSAGTLGVVTENIAVNQEGFITTYGRVNEINTTGSLQGETWSDGDILYLSPTIAGGITNIKPVAPQHLVVVGYVEYAHAIHGKIFVKVDNGYEIDKLHNVLITSGKTEQGLYYNESTSIWRNGWSFFQYLSGWNTKPVKLSDVGGVKIYEYVYSFGTIYRRIEKSLNKDEFWGDIACATDFIIKKEI